MGVSPAVVTQLRRCLRHKVPTKELSQFPSVCSVPEREVSPPLPDTWIVKRIEPMFLEDEEDASEQTLAEDSVSSVERNELHSCSRIELQERWTRCQQQLSNLQRELEQESHSIVEPSLSDLRRRRKQEVRSRRQSAGVSPGRAPPFGSSSHRLVPLLEYPNYGISTGLV